jgi:hypothetical protein
MKDTINWGTWSRRGRAEVWECCLLSMNIDPQTVELDQMQWEYAPPPIAPSTFTSEESLRAYVDRTLEVEAAIDAGAFKIEARLSNANQITLNLGEFARWCKKHELDGVPSELLALDKSDELPAIQRTHQGQSDFLAYLNQASRIFWGKFDPANPSEHVPLKADVVEWLIGKGYSPSLADKGFTIITPENSPKGRPPRK